MQVRDVMTTEVITITPATPFKQIVETMLDNRVSGLPVVDGGVLVGIVTEADLVSKEAYDGTHHRPLEALLRMVTGEMSRAARAEGLSARELMTGAVHTASASDSVAFAARMMLEFGVKRLPVVHDGDLVGVVSRRDLLKAFARPDAELTEAIRTRLGDARQVPEDIEVKVSVDEGVAILEGSVRIEYDRPVVVGAIREIPGVVHVIDNLTARD